MQSEKPASIDLVDDVLTMQDALVTLAQYWENHGCLLMQPANTEVGAGTLNPATALRVLGPEPWRVAYPEPSVRPDDSRYGDNPNRIATHTQYQVILKPEPGDAQQLYLGSLRALGIDDAVHDIRFVEDNWASPALGAWGLGWEVWLDGLEITQFTYFQQSGGVTLDPVSVEITYGMERILMALQGVDHFTKIAYNDRLSYGEVLGQAEYEWSRYYLDDADTDTNTRLFDTYEAEAGRLIEARLPIPAHSYVLKCSHAFNVLDSRGAISPTERARAFGRIRGLAHEVAKLWLARREELGHPLGIEAATSAPPLAEPDEITEPATFLLEIAVEELPPTEVDRAVTGVASALRAALAETRLPHGAIESYGSPRRIAALVHDVEPREADHETVVRGPRVAAAFGSDGDPSRAAQGFARGQNVDVADLIRLDTDSRPVPADSADALYVGAVKHVKGRSASAVLSQVVSAVVSGLRSEKNMRWSAPGLSFSRPIRGLVTLLGDSVVPCRVSSLLAGRTTALHRNADKSELCIDSADEYLELLERNHIVVDAKQRRASIVAQATELAASVGGWLDISTENDLIDEITNLVEEPNPLLGAFDPEYLDLPADVLTTVMRKHQRYLPIRDDGGRLLPHFVAVANGPHDDDAVRSGNEAVLRARYEDAAFFWKADLGRPLGDMATRLEKLTFAEHLGSMADRASRIRTLAAELTRIIESELSDADRATAHRAAELAKFDLGSQMVTELSSLAGIMAREYAMKAGETPGVAIALADMELPRASGGALPITLPGAILALADRFDLLAGLFAVGAAPTGSSDPFGMRRAALGIVSILRAQPQLAAITVSDGLRLAAASQPVAVSGIALSEAGEFVARRFAQQQLDAGYDHRLVSAMLPRADTPSAAVTALAELAELDGTAEFAALAAAMQRVRRIVPAGTPAGYDSTHLAEPAELALHETLRKVTAELSGGSGITVAEFTAAAAALVEPIETFFTDVLVMSENREARAARIGLLATIGELADNVVDWSAL